MSRIPDTRAAMIMLSTKLSPTDSIAIHSDSWSNSVRSWLVIKINISSLIIFRMFAISRDLDLFIQAITEVNPLMKFTVLSIHLVERKPIDINKLLPWKGIGKVGEWFTNDIKMNPHNLTPYPHLGGRNVQK